MNSRSYRGRLWPLARVTGVFPVSFKDCECASRLPQQRSDRLPPSYGDVHAPLGTKQECSCPIMVRSGAWTIYSLCVAAFLLPGTVRALILDWQDARSGRGSARMPTWADELITFSDVLTVVACSLICFLQAFLSQDSLLAELHQLQEVDRLLRISPPAVSGLLWLCLVPLVLVLVLDSVASGMTYMNLMKAFNYLPFYGVYLTVYMTEMLFIDEAYSIRMRFLAINERLESVCDLPSYRGATDPSSVVPVDGAWTRSPSKSNVLSIRLSDMQASSKTDNGRRLKWRPTTIGIQDHQLLSIPQLNMAHFLLCRASFAMARRYGVLLLADMLCLLLHLVITAYIFLKCLIGAGRSSTKKRDSDTLFITMQAFWMAVHMGRILLLVLPCSGASAEARRTGALVGVVLSSTAPSTIVHKQLKTFSIQLLHHRVGFHACGLFELSLPLVVSALGAVTTYLVVLLQLRDTPLDVPTNATSLVSQ